MPTLLSDSQTLWTPHNYHWSTPKLTQLSKRWTWLSAPYFHFITSSHIVFSCFFLKPGDELLYKSCISSVLQTLKKKTDFIPQPSFGFRVLSFPKSKPISPPHQGKKQQQKTARHFVALKAPNLAASSRIICNANSQSSICAGQKWPSLRKRYPQDVVVVVAVVVVVVVVVRQNNGEKWTRWANMCVLLPKRMVKSPFFWVKLHQSISTLVTGYIKLFNGFGWVRRCLFKKVTCETNDHRLVAGSTTRLKIIL